MSIETEDLSLIATLVSPQIFYLYLGENISHIYYLDGLIERLFKIVDETGLKSFSIDQIEIKPASITGCSCCQLRENLYLIEIYFKDVQRGDCVVWLFSNQVPRLNQLFKIDSLITPMAFELNRPNIFLPRTYRSNLIERYVNSLEIEKFEVEKLTFEFNCSNGFFNRTVFQYEQRSYLIQWQSVLLPNLHIFQIDRQAVLNEPLSETARIELKNVLFNFEKELLIPINYGRLDSGLNLISLDKSQFKAVSPSPINRPNILCLAKLVSTQTTEEFVYPNQESLCSPQKNQHSIVESENTNDQQVKKNNGDLKNLTTANNTLGNNIRSQLKLRPKSKETLLKSALTIRNQTVTRSFPLSKPWR